MNTHNIQFIGDGYFVTISLAFKEPSFFLHEKEGWMVWGLLMIRSRWMKLITPINIWWRFIKKKTWYITQYMITSVFLHIHKYTWVKTLAIFSNLLVIGNINPISGDKQNTFQRRNTQSRKWHHLWKHQITPPSVKLSNQPNTIY